VKPQVSIGLPVYNGEAFLARALDSLLAQTFTDFEVVISDNASTDRTGEICKEYAERDPRIRYYRQSENFGAAYNYNFTVEPARGKYFKWMAHDDIVDPRFLEACVDGFEGSPDSVVLVFSKVCWVDINEDVIKYYDMPIIWDGTDVRSRVHSLLGDRLRSYLHHPYAIFGLMRTETLRKTRLIQSFHSADRVTLLELALRGDFLEVPEYLFYRRVHDENSVLGRNKSAKDVVRWYNPRRRPKLVAPRTNLFFEYGRSLARAPLSYAEKLSCARVLSRAVRREWRVLGREVETGVRQMFS
jgi:glycosyltransferase involved in cell wall biosynthesis